MAILASALGICSELRLFKNNYASMYHKIHQILHVIGEETLSTHMPDVVVIINRQITGTT